MEEQSYLLKRSVAFVSGMFAGVSGSVTSHALEHTKQVVRASRIIGRASKLGTEQLNIVMIAAWFHDVGYLDGVEGHEERSAAIAAKMLSAWGAHSATIADVSRCILATKFPQNPKDILGMVLCDAVLAHLASHDYEAKVLRHQRNIQQSMGHRYFTEYGNEILDRRKKVSLSKMIERLYATPYFHH